MFQLKVVAQRESELKDSTEICKLMLNSHCVTPAAVIVKKFFMILQMTTFLFFFYFINKKNRKQVKLIEDWVYFSTDLGINSLGRPSFVDPVVGLHSSRVGRENTHFSLPHPLALFLLASLGGSPHSLNTWKKLFDIFQSRSNEHFCLTDNINENNVSPV